MSVKKAQKKTQTHTHVPTIWGVVIIGILLIGMLFAVWQGTKQETQNYRSDAAVRKPTPRPIKKPTPAPKRVKSICEMNPRKCQ